MSILDPLVLAEATGNRETTEMARVARERLEGALDELKGVEA